MIMQSMGPNNQCFMRPTVVDRAQLQCLVAIPLTAADHKQNTKLLQETSSNRLTRFDR